MVFPYDQRRPRSGREVVPYDVAKRLADERNQLLAEVQRLRREKEGLEHRFQELKKQGAAEERRVREAEAVAADLRAELEALANSARPCEEESSQPSGSQEVHLVGGGEEELRRISRLSRRVEELGADLERVQRRNSESVATARREERSRLLGEIATVLDSVNRGLESVPEEGPLRAGLEGIRDQFLGFLKAQGARVLGEPGEALDPRRHQAVAMVESDQVDSGKVVQVARQGIELEDGTVVRPAQVVVAG